jgi:hypothetical protein
LSGYQQNETNKKQLIVFLICLSFNNSIGCFIPTFQANEAPKVAQERST